MIIRNPILPGFHPDPSIVRVGEDYYLATSTFEWFPGVQLFHSKDLVRWELIGHALTQTTQADLKGLPDSCGIWAPCLSYADGTFPRSGVVYGPVWIGAFGYQEHDRRGARRI